MLPELSIEYLEARGYQEYEPTHEFLRVLEHAVENAFINLSPVPVISNAVTKAMNDTLQALFNEYRHDIGADFEDEVFPFIMDELENQHQLAIEDGFSTTAMIEWDTTNQHGFGAA